MTMRHSKTPGHEYSAFLSMVIILSWVQSFFNNKMDFFQNKRICDRILAFSGIKIRSICFAFIFSPFSGSFYHIMLFHSIKILRDRRFFMVLYIQHKISPFCLLETSLRAFRSGFSLLCVKPAIRRNVTQINLMRSLCSPFFCRK